MIDNNRLAAYRARVENALEQILPPVEITPSRLHEAMRYSVLGGGKRLRPTLVYAAGTALAARDDALDACACAVELIHVYSLVHDDLPAMDDDDLRRGKPTCHKAFDEATAVLVGDALQSLAFQILTVNHVGLSPANQVKAVATLAQAAGSRGMAGGQALDLAAVGRQLDLAELENMHIHKTGALIRASVLLGALCAPEADPAKVDALDSYAKCIGLAFQIQDDILDVVGATDTLGKTQGADAARGKPTYPSLLGLEGAREHAQDLLARADAALAPLGEDGEFLRNLAGYIVQRAH